jgi:ribonuclease HII
VGSTFRIGVDENGLGARLGPLIVTGVLAKVDERGTKTLSRALPRAIRADLDDSKRLVSHSDYGLGEAWARALVDEAALTPEAVLDALLLDTREALSAPCPSHVRAQCWGTASEEFVADAALLSRIRRHRAALAERGVEIIGVRSSVLCTKNLNDSRQRKINRFVADLHAMEAVVLRLRELAGESIVATCGKVGGIGQYEKFFGPLSGRLRTALEEGQKKSAYYFPGLGELAFVRDADAEHPLVMLASLVGKYVRELMMARIVRYHPKKAQGATPPSGYHDPITDSFVSLTSLFRRRKRVPNTCFERDRELGLSALEGEPRPEA